MNTAIVGCGQIASRWVRHLVSDPRINLTVLIDPDTTAAATLAARHRLDASQIMSLDEALAAHELDVAVNLTPPAAHAATSRAALRAGLHVLSEKPLTLSLAEAIDLVSLAREYNLVLGVMQNRGHDPRFQSFRQLLHRSAPGPYAVATETFVALRRPGFRTGMDLPATSDLAVHAFDQVRQLIDAVPVQVHCTETAVPFIGAHCALTHIVVCFADGSVFTYQGGFTTGTALQTPATGRWRVEAAAGAASWDGAASITSTTEASTALPPTAPGWQVCLHEMVDALHGAVKPRCLAANTLGSLALLDAARTAARTGRATAVPSIRERAHAER